MEKKMNDKLFDLVIVGSGPAGLSAAIYAARAELNFIVIDKSPVSGGQVINTYEVDNYPGIDGVSGMELSKSFRAHAEKLGAEFRTADIERIEQSSEECNGTKIFNIVIDNDEIIRTRTLIIATGVRNRKLEVKGEKEFSGKGVSYCATCDGAFFRNKTVAVAGGGDVAVEDAIFLARQCKKVYIVHRRDEFRAAKTLVSSLKTLENVEIIFDSTIEEIYGEKLVKGIRIKNVKSGVEKEIEVNGVFIAVGTVPESGLVKDMVKLEDNGSIVAGEDTMTSMPGIFAAGDVRTKPLRQIVTAAADGANAVTAVEKYLM